MIYILILFTFFFKTHFLFGGEYDFSQPKTLSELIDVALQNNPFTKQAWWNAQRASFCLESTKSSYYPQVNFNSNIRNGRTFKYINGPNVNYTVLDAEIILSMLLFDFGERRSSVTGAQMALLAAGWQNNWAIQKVMLNVLEKSYSLFYAQEALEAAVVSRDDARKALEFSQELNSAGMSPITDVYVCKATLAQMEIDVVDRKASFDIQTAKLSTSLGISPEVSVRLAPLGNLPQIPSENIADLIALAMERRCDLIAKQAQLKQALAKEDNVQAKYLPKVAFLGRGGAEQFMHNKDHAGSYEFTLNCSAPLFTGFEATFEQRKAYAEVKMSCHELAALELDIALEVLMYSRNLEAANKMLSFAKINLENASLAYKGTLEKYSVGKEGIAEVSNTLRQLAAARLRYSEIITRFFTSMANLAYATGTL